MSSVKLDWGDRILSLPRDLLLETLGGAGEITLKVLILISAYDELRSDSDALRAKIAATLDCTPKTLDNALDFWVKAGVITIDDAVKSNSSAKSTPKTETTAEVSASPEKTAKAAEKPKKLQSSELPTYSESVCADIIASSGELAGTIDLCQQLLGKIFTPSDVAAIVGMSDHLRLDGDYILTLVKYCADKGKKSLRYIERCAIALFDDGIVTGEQLGNYLKQRETSESNLQTLRRLLGSAERELTQKEKKLFTCWLDEWHFDPEIIKRAWEITVDKIGDANLNYINRVLENWHNSGLSSLEAVDASLEAYQKSKLTAQQSTPHSAKQIAGTESGFESDEIMEAILRRSCGN